MAAIAGWILWGLVALYLVAVLLPYLVAGAPGLAHERVRARLLVGTQALVILAGLTATIALPVSKFHLLWVVPAAFYLVSLTPVNPAFTRWRVLGRRHRFLHQLHQEAVTRDQFLKRCKDLNEPRPI